jgi:hypothetical protein
MFRQRRTVAGFRNNRDMLTTRFGIRSRVLNGQLSA